MGAGGIFYSSGPSVDQENWWYLLLWRPRWYFLPGTFTWYQVPGTRYLVNNPGATDLAPVGIFNIIGPTCVGHPGGIFY